MNTSFNIILFSFILVFSALMIIGAIWLEKIKRLAIETHLIVNSQRSAMQTAIWLLSKRIADEHPSDQMAQEAEMRARQELEMMDKPRRAKI